MNTPFRIGQGYDIHRLVKKRKLVLGGVEIPFKKGLEGHSDADCLTHAIADAILGALGLPDIGHYFPNTDPNLAGIDSQKILKKATAEARCHGYGIANVDATLIAEAPELGPHLDAMKAILSVSMDIEPANLGLKATTHEGIDDLGQGKAIAAHAVCLLYHL